MVNTIPNQTQEQDIANRTPLAVKVDRQQASVDQ